MGPLCAKIKQKVLFRKRQQKQQQQKKTCRCDMSQVDLNVQLLYSANCDRVHRHHYLFHTKKMEVYFGYSFTETSLSFLELNDRRCCFIYFFVVVVVGSYCCVFGCTNCGCASNQRSYEAVRVQSCARALHRSLIT